MRPNPPQRRVVSQKRPIQRGAKDGTIMALLINGFVEAVKEWNTKAGCASFAAGFMMKRPAFRTKGSLRARGGKTFRLTGPARNAVLARKISRWSKSDHGRALTAGARGKAQAVCRLRPPRRDTHDTF